MAENKEAWYIEQRQSPVKWKKVKKWYLNQCGASDRKGSDGIRHQSIAVKWLDMGLSGVEALNLRVCVQTRKS